MSFGPIAFTIPEYDRELFANYWLKPYEPGTTTPKPMATDETGKTKVSRFELNNQGFPITSGGALVVPFIDGRYDLFLFPTAAEADANDTTNALKFADNLKTTAPTDTQVINKDSVAEMKSDQALVSGNVVQTKSYYNDTATDIRGSAFYRIVTSVEFGGTPDEFGDHTLANGNVAVLIKEDIDLAKYGAKPDDVTFDSGPAIQAAINAWLTKIASNPSRLTAEQGEYRSNQVFDIQLPAFLLPGANIDMPGVKISSYSTSTAPFINIRSNGTCRGLMITDLVLDGQNANLHSDMLLIDGGNGAVNEFLYNMQLMRVRIELCPLGGIHWTNNVFESAEVDCHVESRDLTTAFAKQISFGTFGNPSSMEYRGGSTRGGLNGLRLQSGGASDTNIFGGTYILSGEEGIRAINAISLTIEGVHVENCFENGVIGSAAGINVVGSGKISSVFGTSNNNMRTVVSCFSDTNRFDIKAVRFAGAVTNAVEVRSGSDRVTLTDVKRANTLLGSVPVERLVDFGRNTRTTSVQNAANYNHNIDDSDILEVALDQNFSLSTTNERAGDQLIIRFTQDGVGGHTVSFGGTFQFSANVDLTANNSTSYFFYWTGGAWFEVSRTVF